MSLEQTACEDLKAFERRLTEVIACYQPYTFKWRFLLAVMSISTLIGAYCWVTDPALSVLPIKDTLWLHPFFTLSITILALLFAWGVHKKVLAPSIITSRARLVLNEFNMSCDETGKLILKPRPTVFPQLPVSEIPLN